MKIMDYIIYLDLFGQKPGLFINRKAQMRTYIGLLLSLLTYILFILIFLYELQEMLYKQNPNIITNTFDAETYKSSIRFNNNTFRFIVAEVNDERTQYFKLEGYLMLSYYKIDRLIQISKFFSFSKCEPSEVDEDYKVWFNTFYNDTALCPRNLYSPEIENITNFEFHLKITLRECMDHDSSCTVNKTLYDEMRKGKNEFGYNSLIKANHLNVFENDKPFYSKVKISTLFLGQQCKTSKYSFGVNELVSNENYILKSSKVERHFDLKSIEIEEHEGLKSLYSEVLFHRVIQDNTVKVTIRNYKSLTTVIANSFSLIRLALFIIDKLFKYHVKYSIEEVILGNNFYYEGNKAQGSGINDNSCLKVATGLNNTKPVAKFIEVGNSKKLSKQGNLSIKDIYLNISCWRYLLCRRRIRMLQFYKEANSVVISKYFSVEYLLYTLLEFKRFKLLSLKEKDDTKVDLMTEDENIRIAFTYSDLVNNINNESISESLVNSQSSSFVGT
jgi:hypothetical protein